MTTPFSDDSANVTLDSANPTLRELVDSRNRLELELELERAERAKERTERLLLLHLIRRLHRCLRYSPDILLPMRLKDDIRLTVEQNIGL